MNEFQVGMAESTCSGVFSTSAVGNGGKALLSIDELSRIGLERCDSSRCAVQLMGDLAVQYGFYGADGGTEGGSESLMVTDPEEGFIFHILPDDTGTSAIWVAQRVPDDHIGAVTNMFVIRNVNLSDSYNFLGSSNMFEIGERHNLLPKGSTKDSFDFTATFSDGEYGSKFYSGRRVWGFYTVFTNLSLPDNYTDLRYDAVYPVTTTPKRLLSVYDFMDIYTNYYQGTKYDMTKGMAAGPWGTPDRWASWSSPVQGNWERSIGIYRTAHTHIVQSRGWMSGPNAAILFVVCLFILLCRWYGPDKASTSIFVPISSGSLGVNSKMSIGNPSVLDRVSAYWASRFIFNMVQLKYEYMVPYIKSQQLVLFNASLALISKLDKVTDVSEITSAYSEHADSMVLNWWGQSDYLMQVFADGYNTPTYPDWWLKSVGYQNGPPPPPTEKTSKFV